MIGALGLRAGAVDLRGGSGPEPTQPGADYRLLPRAEHCAAGRPEALSCIPPSNLIIVLNETIERNINRVESRNIETDLNQEHDFFSNLKIPDNFHTKFVFPLLRTNTSTTEYWNSKICRGTSVENKHQRNGILKLKDLSRNFCWEQAPAQRNTETQRSVEEFLLRTNASTTEYWNSKIC